MNLTLLLLVLGLGYFVGMIYIFNKIFPNVGEHLGIFLVILHLGISIFTPMITHQLYVEEIQYSVEKHEYYPKSLGNDKYMNGEFGLFTGSINEVDYYFFYVEYSTGMMREKLRVSECYIVETNRKPEIVGVYKKYKDEGRTFKIMDEHEPSFYRIYVPHNTIIKDFKVR